MYLRSDKMRLWICLCSYISLGSWFLLTLNGDFVLTRNGPGVAAKVYPQRQSTWGMFCISYDTQQCTHTFVCHIPWVNSRLGFQCENVHCVHSFLRIHCENIPWVHSYMSYDLQNIPLVYSRWEYSYDCYTGTDNVIFATVCNGDVWQNWR